MFLVDIAVVVLTVVNAALFVIVVIADVVAVAVVVVGVGLLVIIAVVISKIPVFLAVQQRHNCCCHYKDNIPTTVCEPQ